MSDRPKKGRQKKFWDPISQRMIQPPGPGRPKGSRSATDLTGQTFRNLTVLERVEDANGSRAQYRCLCDCGAETVVRSDNLKSGRTVSCGHVGYADPFSVIGRPVMPPPPEDWRERGQRALAKRRADERRWNGL